MPGLLAKLAEPYNPGQQRCLGCWRSLLNHLVEREQGLKTFFPEPKTSIPNKTHKKYSYLLRCLEIGRPGQVWSADISYLPIGRGHVYLVGIIDWYSRKILSYRISNPMDCYFCLAAEGIAISMDGKGRCFDEEMHYIPSEPIV